tara:strand:+ start:959 stop:1591 length:633 start_codon:yes stop_codon:yes gene_type:complete
MINRDHKFIFIHIPKTGGTSIESVFVADAAEKDVPFKHGNARQYQKKFSKAFSSYFKTSVVRNPWDMVASLYSWLWHTDSPFNRWPKKWRSQTQTPLDWTLNEWIKSDQFLRSSHRALSIDNPHPRQENTQLDWISDSNGDLLIDYIMRFENLQHDFDTVCDIIGIPAQKLPHLNKSKRKHYSECYDNEARKIVAEKYAKDIDYFGYKFG